MTEIINAFQNSAGNLLLMILLIGTHVYFTVKLKFIQRRIPEGIRLSFSGNQREKGGISPYAALSTALAATIGTGNIIGISTAIAIGGPGAVFWCWLSGFFGVATSYAESFLSVKYRIREDDGTYVGGPMYVLEHALHNKKLAIVFAVFTLFASFGVGSSVQSQAIGAAITSRISVSPHVIGIVAAMLAGKVLLGGGKSIAKVCMFLVPVMSLFYICGCLAIIVLHLEFVPEAVLVIVKSAFSSKSIAGGIGGCAVMTAMRVGLSKGLFTNEAGMGSIGMSAAGADTDSPVRQGLISMTGVFWDTIVLCAITGIAIVSTMLKTPQSFVNLASDKYCYEAFATLPGGEWLLTVSLVLFAFATIIGWSYYGECAAGYLFGKHRIGTYQLILILMVYFGTVLSLETVWGLADMFNILMVLPNFVTLFALRKIIVKETLCCISRRNIV